MVLQNISWYRSANWKKKYTTKRGFRTQKEAKIALARLEMEIQKMAFPLPLI